MSNAVIFALVCAVAALVYGGWSINWILAKPAGNDRMREIAAGDPAGRAGLSQPAVLHDRHRRRHPLRRHLGGAGRADGGRICGGRGALGTRRLHRHERVGALERAHGRGRAHRAERGAGGGLSRRRDHRLAGRRPGPARRGGLLLVPRAIGAVRPESDEGGPARHDRAAGRPGVRRIADLDFRASRRRHLHQGRRRRRRPRRQGRSRHSRGRPAQPCGHRGQRRRQRRRLRRHGGRPVRDLCGDHRRHDAARRAAAAHQRRSRGDLSARARRVLDPRLDRRLFLRQGAARRQDHERAVSRTGGRRRHLRDRLLVHHRSAHGRRGRGRSAVDDAAPVGRGSDRTGADRSDGRHHRVLHRDRVQAGAARRASVDHGPRDQHHRRPRRLDEVDGVAGDLGVHRDPRVVLARGLVRHRGRRDGDAVDDRHHRRARRLRTDHRQRRRHRRDGQSARLGARHHRSSRRGGQHDQGSDQGLRHRLGRPGRAGAVRRLHARAPGLEHQRLASTFPTTW